MVWETVPTNYCFIFLSPLKVWVFFLQSIISQVVYGSLERGMKYETNVIAIIT
jgi:hypothetical protein